MGKEDNKDKTPILLFDTKPGGNYDKMVDANLSDIINPGDIFVSTVQHDDWCNIWSGKLCNCSPNVITQKIDP